MTSRSIIATVLVLLALPVSAQAVTLTYADGSPAVALQAWADASHVPTPTGTVVIHRSPCFNGVSENCALGSGDQIWMAMVESPKFWRVTFSHELGHVFDFKVMTPRAREAFAQAMHLVGRDWWVGDEGSPGELFAESYALCFRRRAIQQPAFLGFSYGPKRHRRVCRIIRQAAAGVYGVAPYGTLSTITFSVPA